MLGFSSQVPELLSASDLLVSPAHYEPYGLNVQEAICRDLPAIVSRQAGVAEQYPKELDGLLLDTAGDQSELTARLLSWTSRRREWQTMIHPLGERLRKYTWDDMARQIVEIAATAKAPAAAGPVSAALQGSEL